MFKRGLILILLLGNIYTIGATVVDGTLSMKYFPQNYVFRDGDSAQGFIRFRDGFTVMPGSTHLDLWNPVHGDIDLRLNGIVELDGDLKFDNNTTITGGGRFNGSGENILLEGDLIVAEDQNIVLSNAITINGNGNTLKLKPHAQLKVDSATTVTLRNMTIVCERNNLDSPAIELLADTANLTFDNVILKLGNDFNFSQGRVFFENDVKITGTGIFSQAGSSCLSIAKESALLLDSGITFSYSPGFTDSSTLPPYQDRFTFHDKTSSLYLNDCTLTTNRLGMRLTKGSLYFDNTVTINTLGAVGLLHHTLSLKDTFLYAGALFSAVSASMGTRYAIGSRDGFVVFDESTRKRVDTRVFDGLTAIAPAVGTDKVAVASCGADPTVRIFSSRSSLVLDTEISTTNWGPTYSISWAPNNNYLVGLSKGETQTLHICSVDSEGIISNGKSIVINDESLGVSVCSPGESYPYVAVSCPTEKKLKLFSLADGSLLSTISLDFSPTSIAWSYYGSRLVCCALGKLSIFSVSSEGVLTLIKTFESPYIGNKCCLDRNYQEPDWAENEFEAKIATAYDTKITFFDVSSSDLSCYLDFDINTQIVDFSANLYWGKFDVVTPYGLRLYEKIDYSVGRSGNRPPSFSNCITIGNGALGASHDIDVNIFHGAQVRVNGLIRYDTALANWFTHNQIGLEINTGNYTLTEGLFLDKPLMITENCLINGAGNTISFEQNKANVIKIAAGKSVVFTNVVLKDFDDKAISLGDATSSFAFGDNVTIESSRPSTLTKDWIFTGNSSFDGFGNSLSLGDFNIKIFEPAMVTLQNSALIGVKNNNIRCMNDYATIILRNCEVNLDDNFTFTVGGINFENDVKVKGNAIFSYEPSGGRISTVAANSTLFFDEGVTFSYAPQTADQDLLAFTDKTAALFLNGCTLKATSTGMRLTRGSIYFDNTVTISTIGSIYTPSLLEGMVNFATFSTTALNFASVSPDGNSLAIIDFLLMGSQGPETRFRVFRLADGVLSGGIIQTSSFAYTSLSWSPDSAYIAVACDVGVNMSAVKVFHVNNGIWDNNPIAEVSGSAASWSADGLYIAVVANIELMGAFLQVIPFIDGELGTPQSILIQNEGGGPVRNVSIVACSPHGDYIAVAGYSNAQSQSVDYINIYSKNGETLTLVGSLPSLSGINSLSWAPNGGYIGSSGGGGTFVASVSAEGTIAFSSELGTEDSNCSWSSDGNFIVTNVGVYSFANGVASLIESFSGTNIIFNAQFCNSDQYVVLIKNSNAFYNSAAISIERYKINVNQDITPSQQQETISNAFSFGNNSKGSAEDIAIHMLSGAKTKVYGLINHETGLHTWQTRNQFGREVNSLSYSQDEDLFLSKDQSLIVNESCVFNGNGHSIWFARNQLNLIQIAPGKSIIFTNVVFKDFNDAAILLGAGSAVTFGDESVIEYSMPGVLAHDLQFAGNAIIRGSGYSIDLSTHYLGIRQPGLLTLQDIVFNNVDDHKIRCIGDNASIVFRNSDLVLDGNFTFSTGSFTIQDDVIITGTHTFSFEGSGQKTSRIAANSTLLLDTGVTFSYAPRAANQDLLAFTNVTSRLYLNGCTLKTTSTGMRLTKGTMIVDNQNSVYNDSPSSMSGAFTLGNGIAADDLTIQIMPNANIEMVEGSMVYANQQ